MPLHTPPRRFATPLLVDSNQGEVPFTEISAARALGYPFYLDTQVRFRKFLFVRQFYAK